MKATFEIDRRSVEQLTRAIQEYAVVSKKDRTYATNKALKDVAMRAVNLTHHADKEKLRSELADPKIARARFISKLRRQGKPIPRKEAFAAALRAFKAATLRSVNFMRAGWIPAINKLKNLVRESSEKPQSLGGKKGWGGVVPAHDVGQAIEGEIFNRSISKKSSTSEWALDKYGTPALNAAIVDKTKDMQVYITRKHEERSAKFNT